METRPIFIGSEIYRTSTYGAWHPLRVPRVSTVMDLSRSLGWVPENQYITSPRAKPKALEIWHERPYIDALVDAEKTQIVSDATKANFAIGTASNPVFPEVYRRPATAAGGSLLAGELVSRGGIVFNPAGGTHHGMPGRANGFCYLNDPVLAMLSLRRMGVQRLLYLDIDAHHPDGVAVAFRNDPDCMMISVHEDGLWPRTGGVDETEGGSALNIPVRQGFNDAEMSLVLTNLILPMIDKATPDAIILQCGADGVEEDPQSHMSLSNNAHFEIVRRIKDIAPRFLVLGGGGYNPWSVGRLWTGVWGILNGLDMPDRLPENAEAVLRKLRFDGNRRGRNPPEHWFTTLYDAPQSGAIHPKTQEIVDYLKQREFGRTSP
jgi:acetoin utilization protein AcuC